MASALKTIEILEKEDVIEQLWAKGEVLRSLIESAAEILGLSINLRGNPVRSVLEILGPDGKPDRIAYSLFLQETVKKGILFGVPIFPCHAHTIDDIDKTAYAVYDAFEVIAKAQAKGDELAAYLEGGPIALPVIRA
jgi:glutamate-1-semialdehyde aminotransferase